MKLVPLRHFVIPLSIFIEHSGGRVFLMKIAHIFAIAAESSWSLASLFCHRKVRFSDRSNSTGYEC